MANIWDALKKSLGNAGSAWQETQKNPYTAFASQNNGTPAVKNEADMVAGVSPAVKPARETYAGSTDKIADNLGDVKVEDIPAKNTESSSNGADAYINALQQMRAERQAMLDAQYKQGKNNIENTAADSNRQAYIAYMQGIKNMPQAAAMYGSGGMAQSLANKSQLNYENNRNNIEAAKLASLTDLESDYRAGVLDAGNDYLDKLASVKQKTVTGAGTVADGSPAGKIYKVANLGITAADEVDLYKKLMAAGLSQTEAEQYLISQGIVSKPSYGTPKR